MGAVTVRLAQVGDLSGVLRLHSPAAQPDGAAGVPTTRQQATWIQMLGTEGLSVYVADAPAEGVVGTATMLTMPNLGYDCRPSAFIEAMVVAPGRRRSGVGRLLVQRALEDAGARGCHKIQLLTHKRHAEDGAHDFYRAMGFAPEAEGFRRYL